MTQQVEELFQGLTVGIDLLNLLFAADALEKGLETLSADRRHALGMALLRNPVYSKPEQARQAYEELARLKLALEPPYPSQEDEISVGLRLVSPSADQMLRFLRAVMAQKEDGAQGSNVLCFLPKAVEAPEAATKDLVDELFRRLADV